MSLCVSAAARLIRTTASTNAGSGQQPADREVLHGAQASARRTARPPGPRACRADRARCGRRARNSSRRDGRRHFERGDDVHVRRDARAARRRAQSARAVRAPRTARSTTRARRAGGPAPSPARHRGSRRISACSARCLLPMLQMQRDVHRGVVVRRGRPLTRVIDWPLGGIVGRTIVNGSAVCAIAANDGKPATSPAILKKTESPGVNGMPRRVCDWYVRSGVVALYSESVSPETAASMNAPAPIACALVLAGRRRVVRAGDAGIRRDVRERERARCRPSRSSPADTSCNRRPWFARSSVRSRPGCRSRRRGR